MNKKAINVTATNQIPQREIIGIEDFHKKYKEFSLIIVTESLTKENYIGLDKFLKREIQ